VKYTHKKYHKHNDTNKAVKEVLRVMWRFKGYLWAPLIFAFLLELMQMGNRFFISEILRRVELSDWQGVAVFLALKPGYDFILRRIDVMVVLTTVRNIGYDLYRGYEKMTVEHVSGLGHAFFTGIPISKIISRINGISNIIDVVEEGFWSLIANVFQIGISIVVLFATLPITAPIVLLTFFLFIRFHNLMLKAQEPVKKRRKDKEEERDEVTMRIASTALTLISNSALDRTLQDHDKKFRNLRKVGMLELMIVLSGNGLMRDVVTHLGRLAVLAVSILALVEGQIGLPSMILVYTVSETMFSGFWGVVRFLLNFTYQTPKVIKTSELLEVEPAFQEPTKPKQFPRGPLEVKFEDVYFCYPQVQLGEDTAESNGNNADLLEKHQLIGINLLVPAGKKVGIVGPSGSGKSTITLFPTKMQLPTHGSVLINGIDIRDLNGNELRKSVATVQQGGSIDIYRASLRYNLTFGEEYSDEQIWKALEAAMLSELVAEWDKGLDEQIGERGRSLSGGQVQRVAIARAILRNPHLIILDEATSALDSQTERLIQKSLDNLLDGRTAIIIAHRLSTLRNVDKIVVMRKGEIVEEGTWAELVAQGGLFAELVQTQNLE